MTLEPCHCQGSWRHRNSLLAGLPSTTPDSSIAFTACVCEIPWLRRKRGEEMRNHIKTLLLQIIFQIIKYITNSLQFSCLFIWNTNPKFLLEFHYYFNQI